MAEVMVVLPTLGDRIDTLKETLESVKDQSTMPEVRVLRPIKFKGYIRTISYRFTRQAFRLSRRSPMCYGYGLRSNATVVTTSICY